MSAELPSDLELTRRARDGDDGAFRMLVERYESLVAATAVGMLGPGPDAEDVGQETFIRFHAALGRFPRRLGGRHLSYPDRHQPVAQRLEEPAAVPVAILEPGQRRRPGSRPVDGRSGAPGPGRHQGRGAGGAATAQTGSSRRRGAAHAPGVLDQGDCGGPEHTRGNGAVAPVARHGELEEHPAAEIGP